MKLPVLIFDVNETLLDVSALALPLSEVFGSPPPTGEWFARLLHGSVVANYTGQYRPFGTIGSEALATLARRRNVELSPEKAESIVASMLSLPPHPDVIPGLTKLSDAGFYLATLTNSSSQAAAAQMRNAGLDGFFRSMISVEEVQLFKPAPEVYRKASELLAIELSQGLLIAAHDWDIAGAQAAGMPGAFIGRPGAIWGIPNLKPDLVVSDLVELADRIS
ncbi:MAG: haloacid dehalogenase type II [Acidimicrobiia bacterium]